MANVRPAVDEGTLAERLTASSSNYLTGFLDFCRRKPMGAFGLFIFIGLVFLASTAQWVAPYDPVEQFQGKAYPAPTLEHPFGTDYVGRDMLSRIIWGARISLMVGIVSVVFSTSTGTFLGITSGYWGGRF